MSIEGYTDEDLANLTDVERAALEEDDGSGGAADDNTDDQGAADDQDEQDAGGDDAGAAAADDDGAAAAGEGGQGDAAGADDEPGAAQGEQARAPLLVAEAPADADTKLAEIAASKAELRQKYDDGDITFEEYEAQKETLDEQRLEIKQAVAEARIAEKMMQQQARNEFLAYANKFTSEMHPEYARDKDLYTALDQQVIELANMPKYATLTGAQIMEKAHRLVMLDHPEKFQATSAQADTKPAKQGSKPNEKVVPPSLHAIPAAEPQDTTGGKWAALDRLSPDKLEDALMKMSDADRAAYLAAR